MADIYETLDFIRKHPKMDIGEESLSNLWWLLQGYQMALIDQKDIVENGIWGWKSHQYVARRFSDVPRGFNKGPRDVILEHTGGDETKALELFFRLVDEFRKSEQQN